MKKIVIEDKNILSAPLVKNGISIVLPLGKKEIKIKAITDDKSKIQVEGCIEKEISNDEEVLLHPEKNIVIFTGKITEFYCGNNEIQALNTQGCTSLTFLNCNQNKLKELDLRKNLLLTKLFLEFNEFETIDLSKN
ncbi:hypothetical protein [Treponema denticola]|uniref:hypothetical protein n=1 Tax=Treponema denticola TaxID=158 RepID=UPI0021027BEC|nr:hypothetical protein [Treponema denticola]UTY25521.1 hypothetical protein E4N77_01650 [Treponema denticola]